jgi:hypothetical protein
MKRVSIRPDLYEELELFAKKFDLSVEQLVDRFIEKEVTESAKKELFSPGLTWDIPKNNLIMSRTRKEDLLKLQNWFQNGDILDIIIDGKEGEFFIANSTNQAEHRASAGKVDLRICNVPEKLLNDFDEKSVRKHFGGGRNEAIRCLMADAINQRMSAHLPEN